MLSPPVVSLVPAMSSRLPMSAAESEHGDALADSTAWVDALRRPGAERDRAVARLHELLLRAARFEVSRRRAALSHVRGEELDDLALQAADDALVAVLGKLDDYRGASRFTTWAYKFALLEAGVRLRRRAWQEREVVLEPEVWPLMADAGQSPQRQAEANELMAAVTDSIDCCLTEHQREVLVALALERGAARRALGSAEHDARRPLQDPSRRTAKAAHRTGDEGLCPRLDLAEKIMDRHTNDNTLKRLLGPAEREVLCDECFERLDEYVELELQGERADERLPGCAPTSRAAPPAARTTRASARS